MEASVHSGAVLPVVRDHRHGVVDPGRPCARCLRYHYASGRRNPRLRPLIRFTDVCSAVTGSVAGPDLDRFNISSVSKEQVLQC
ncbi:hypothetical protein OEZ86_002103 [Tetradesmus obliquus]|nr:hypothetical protein OEZ86_002103 [Tetradesmus obliquus]